MTCRAPYVHRVKVTIAVDRSAWRMLELRAAANERTTSGQLHWAIRRYLDELPGDRTAPTLRGPGRGRKACDQHAANVSITVRADLYDQLRLLARRDGIAIAEELRRAILFDLEVALA